MTIPTIEERNLIIQSVIDRLLYLSDNEREVFNNMLTTLCDINPIDVKIIDGVRVYNTTKRVSNEQSV